MNRAEEYVNAGTALVQLGRWLQRYHPKVDNEGAQFGEDAILAKLLPEDRGIYVDIGANHSRECSNTWQLYQRGWRGLLIEPLPDCWPNLLEERREDRLCPFAASNASGFASLRVCRAISSLRPDWNSDATETIPVKVLPLWEILRSYRDYDWTQTRLCSIDVEGHEKEVLEGIDWRTFHPAVIVIEYRDYDSKAFGKDTSAQWSPILTDNNYEMIHQNPLNQIWKRK